jgi:hypothetical protein
LHAQEKPTPNSPESALSDAEKREAIFYIDKFSISVEAERLLREALKREQDLADRERNLADRDIQNEKERTALAQKEMEIEKQRAAFYQNAYETVTKKPSFGCRLKQFFTFGLSKCG